MRKINSYYANTIGISVRDQNIWHKKKFERLFSINSNQSRNSNQTPNVTFYESSKKIDMSSFHPLIEDLLNISIGVFYSDVITIRRVNTRWNNTRSMYIGIPVSNKEIWDELKEDLEHMLSFLTYDVIRLSFQQKKKKKESKDNQKVEYTKADSVSLFSGGLDSFAGSQYLIHEQNLNPLFLSVNHGNIAPLLKNMYKFLDRKYERYVFNISSALKPLEFTEFSRSLLYLGFGVSLSHKFGIHDLYVPENGIVSTQYGLQSGRMVTRTVHPKFIKLYAAFVNKLLGDIDLHIINPFRDMTKSQVVEIIQKYNPNALAQTSSCSHIRFFHAHCGMCMPCIIREIAFLNNRVEIDSEKEFGEHGIDFLREVDLRSPVVPERLKSYFKKIPPIRNFFSDGVTFTLDLLTFVNEIQNLSEKELINRYPELLDKNTFEMYRRFSNEVIEAVRRSGKNEELVKIKT